jgi:hypothetical protein
VKEAKKKKLEITKLFQSIYFHIILSHLDQLNPIYMLYWQQQKKWKKENIIHFEIKNIICGLSPKENSLTTKKKKKILMLYNTRRG